MNGLTGYSDTDLHAELIRRKKVKLVPPPINKKPDLTPLRNCVESTLRVELDREYHDEDTPQFIYEKVMEMFYGKEFWDWHNNLPWR